MALFEIINENRLATISLVLGLMAIAIFALLRGIVNSFLFLGIPAIVTGAVSLTRLRRQRNRSHIASILLAGAGIALGVLSMFATVWANL